MNFGVGQRKLRGWITYVAATPTVRSQEFAKELSSQSPCPPFVLHSALATLGLSPEVSCAVPLAVRRERCQHLDFRWPMPLPLPLPLLLLSAKCQQHAHGIAFSTLLYLIGSGLAIGLRHPVILQPFHHAMRHPSIPPFCHPG